MMILTKEFSVHQIGVWVWNNPIFLKKIHWRLVADFTIQNKDLEEVQDVQEWTAIAREANAIIKTLRNINK